jgi:hypothetical protein
MNAMEKLVLALMVWASAQTGLPVPEDMPEVRTVDRCEIERLYFDDAARKCGNASGGVQAIYDHRASRMLLPDTWSPENIYDISMLVHELVHHLQAEAGKTPETVSCVGRDLEKPAYDAQIAFLEAAGLDPLAVMGINGLAYKLLTLCEEPLLAGTR